MSKQHIHRRWTEASKYVLAEEPLCRHCMEQGRITQATEVDHIVELRDGGAFLDRDNLQPLCSECHDAKTYKRRGFTLDGTPIDGW